MSDVVEVEAAVVESCQSDPNLARLATLCAVCALAVTPVFAQEGGGSDPELTVDFMGAVTTVFGYMAGALAAALIVFGAKFGITKGIQMFKRFAG